MSNERLKTKNGGAAVVLALGIVGSEDVFYSQETGIDWDVIFLLLGMMIIVSVVRQTGVFEYVAIWAAKRANGKCPAALFMAMDALRRGERQRAREQLQLAQARCPTVSELNWAASSELKRF